MMSFIQQFYQDCLVKFALMGRTPAERLYMDGESDADIYTGSRPGR